MPLGARHKVGARVDGDRFGELADAAISCVAWGYLAFWGCLLRQILWAGLTCRGIQRSMVQAWKLPAGSSRTICASMTRDATQLGQRYQQLADARILRLEAQVAVGVDFILVGLAGAALGRAHLPPTAARSSSCFLAPRGRAHAAKEVK